MATRTCPTCGALTPARFPLCGQCGTRAAPDATPDEIRRFATVVNSDLKGSTALGERLDPESLREVLTLYFDEMRLVFESHGGTIEKIIGDAIVAVFGVPVRHEDDALRAVEACAESQRVLANLNDRLDATWGVRLVVRTGVATGDVVFGEASLGQHVLAGDTMQVSSAMEQHAPPFEVLLAESTFELVRDLVEAEAAEPVTPKGMDLVVPAYRLVAVAERAGTRRPAPAAMTPGTRLCNACGEENPESFRHCGTCGAFLAVVTPARESRKTVTLIFADPKPTTADGSPPSPEALRDVMSVYFEAMRVALERHGGTVEKFIGDAVMAVFGLPIRHEDDALRAIRAAADMQAALPALNDGFRTRWGLELRNHIGVNTGEVIAGDATLGQRLVTGDAVNTAARLEQAAGAQEIVLGELTYRLAREHIDVDAIPPLSLKGKAEPVPAYRLVAVRTAPLERTARSTPFVGRESEMARLRDALFDAEGRHHSHLVTVVGDAGVGKSRLIREFAISIGDHAEVVRGRCLPYGDGITFWPIGEIVRSVVGIGDDDEASTAVAKMTAFVTEGATAADDPRAIAERTASAIGLSAVAFQMPELFWGIRKFLESLARRRPLVVIVDDLHAAAPAFLELIDHLLEAVTTAPILLLTTARHELGETHPEWSSEHESARITLEPLTAADAGSIIEQLLDGLDPTVSRRIVEAAEGNPLYVEQITSMLVETGAIRRDGDRWTPTASSGEVPIPPTVQALVAARLDALAPDERAVVEPASVIGLSFPRDAVNELVDEAVRPSLPEHLGSLAAKQLVRSAAAVSDEELYRFGHLVIKDTAYGSLLKRVRVVLHERFVDWGERVNRERGRATEFEEIHGYHLEQAYRYRTELGPTDDAARAVGRRASEKLSSAGRRALARSDMAAASDLLARAVALLPDDDRTRIELLPELAEARIDLGELAGAREAITTALDAATAIGDERLIALARTGALILGVFGAGHGLEPGGEEALAEIITTLERLGDDAGLARAWRARALIYSRAGQFDEAASAAERLIEHAARAGDQRLVARGAAGFTSQSVYSSRSVPALTERIEAFAEQVRDDRKAGAVIALGLAELHAMQGEFDEARALYRQGQEVLRELGLNVSTMCTSLSSSRVESLAGDYRRAEAELRRDDTDLAAIDERYYRSSVVAALARVLLALDDRAGAADACAVVERIADPEDADPQVMLRAVRARLLGEQGDRTALTLIDEAVALSDDTSDVILQADVLVDQGLVLRDLGEPDAAEPPLRAALERYERKGDVVSAGRTRALLGQAATV